MFCLVLWLELLDWLHVSIVTQFRINQKLARQCSVSVCLLVSPSVLQCCQNNNCNKKTAQCPVFHIKCNTKRKVLCTQTHTSLTLSPSLSLNKASFQRYFQETSFEGSFEGRSYRNRFEYPFNHGHYTKSTMKSILSQQWRLHPVNQEDYTKSTMTLHLVNNEGYTNGPWRLHPVTINITPNQPWGLHSVNQEGYTPCAVERTKSNY